MNPPDTQQNPQALHTALPASRYFRKKGGFPPASTTDRIEVPHNGRSIQCARLPVPLMFPSGIYSLEVCLSLVASGDWEEVGPPESATTAALKEENDRLRKALEAKDREHVSDLNEILAVADDCYVNLKFGKTTCQAIRSKLRSRQALARSTPAVHPEDAR